MSSQPRACRERAALVWLALLVLGLGLPQLLIVCRGHDGSVQLAFQHDPAECCHDGGNHHRSGQDGGAHRHLAAADLPHPGLERAPDCEHEDLAIGVAPTPRPSSSKVPPLQLTFLLPPRPPAPRPAPSECAAPPLATGPPPTAAHLRAVAATRLLL